MKFLMIQDSFFLINKRNPSDSFYYVLRLLRICLFFVLHLFIASTCFRSAWHYIFLKILHTSAMLLIYNFSTNFIYFYYCIIHRSLEPWLINPIAFMTIAVRSQFIPILYTSLMADSRWCIQSVNKTRWARSQSGLSNGGCAIFHLFLLFRMSVQTTM